MEENGKNKAVRFDQMDPEMHRELSRKGGYAAAESNKQRATFKKALEWALEMPAFNNSDALMLELQRKFPDSTLTNRDAMAIAMVQKVIQERDTRAFVALRDTTGELPEQMINIKNEQPLVITVETV